MKKKMIGLCALLMAVVMTGYSVSGTYAKYTDSTTAGDEARVAKWGIDTTTTIELFNNSYISSDNPAKTDVESADGEKVVAPGTSGIYTFALGGMAPETNYTLSVEDTGNTVDNIGKIVYYLKAVDTAPAANATFDSIGFTDADKALSITDLIDKINAKYSNKVYAANSSDEGVYVIGWKWAFENATDMTTNDTTDTNLGNKATLDTVKLDVKITATQTEKAAN